MEDDDHPEATITATPSAMDASHCAASAARNSDRRAGPRNDVHTASETEPAMRP